MENKSKKIIASLSLSFLGLFSAVYALIHRTKLLNSTEDKLSSCNINSFINCDKVALSPYSQIFGIPTSSLGIFFFTFLIIYFTYIIFSKKSTGQSFLKFSINAALLLGILNVIHKLYLMFFVINGLCLACLLSHIVVVILFILNFKISSLKKINPTEKTTWIFALSSALVAMLTTVIVLNNNKTDKHITDNLGIAISDFNNEQPIDLKEENGVTDPEKNNAKIIISEFSDFQCPFCARTSKNLTPFASQKDVKLVFNHFPLDSNCNPKIKNNFHIFSCYMSKASQCVYNINGWDEFAKVKSELFYNQKKIATNKAIQDIVLANSTITIEELKNCVNDEKTHNQILKSVENGIRLNVQSTPTVYINGKLLKHPHPKVVQKIISDLRSKYK